ncbi:cache domain-containing protein [Enterobacter roggenkampii]|uniref:cache domain-containing protein n=1 Tax=Enterobacter roggenkampii TaxID=1812935 RepID=UPI0022372836|nr:cache domain-containing protein [Enterobacter roggenkampii]MCW5004220.1 cache domain-containing protein [Enterobacter roggenkampii]
MPGSTKKKRLSVNNMLLLLIIVMFISFLIVSIWACGYIPKETAQTFESNLTRFTNNTAMESVHRQLDEIELAFTIIASRVDKHALDEYIRPEQSILNSILVSMVNSLPFFNAVLLSDTNNHYSAYPDSPPGHFVPSERPWFPSIKKRNEIVYSEPYMDSYYSNRGEKGMPTVTVSMNLFQNNVERIGNIAFDLDLAALSAPLQDIFAPFCGKFMVAAKNGSIAMHPNLKMIYHILVPLRWIEPATDLEGYFFNDETQKFASYRSFSNPSWVAFTIIDKKEYDNYVSSAPLMLISVLKTFSVYKAEYALFHAAADYQHA